jgi:DNA-binding winged helix-turn-helix (wHTH) protein
MRLPARVQFGECLLDRDARQFVRQGELVHLTPKAFALLELLLESRPRVVRKSEIHQRLWPDCHVSATTLTALVAELRRALSGDAADDGPIRTVYGYGYAFNATVTQPPTDDSQPVRVVWQGGSTVLGPGEHVIGRAPDCAIRLLDRRISRHHARLIVSLGGVLVEDCRSHNGTTLNGTAVSDRTVVHDCDVLSVGGVALSIDISGSSIPSTVDE